jgi:hypothetical protein
MVVEQVGSVSWVLIYVAVSVGIINVCLLLGLLHAYWKTYKRMKTGFTIGLLYFSTFLLLQNLVSTIFLALPLLIPVEYQISRLSDLHSPQLPLLLINIVQLIALSLLLKITRK